MKMKDESKNTLIDTEDCTTPIPSACAVGWVAPLPEPIYNEDGITLYCADCTRVLPLLEPMSADLVLTDPPYNVGVKYETHEDTMQDYRLWCEGWLMRCKQLAPCVAVTPGMMNHIWWCRISAHGA